MKHSPERIELARRAMQRARRTLARKGHGYVLTYQKNPDGSRILLHCNDVVSPSVRVDGLDRVLFVRALRKLLEDAEKGGK